MLFSPEFSYILSAILAVLAIFFFLGKGDKILDAFQSKSAPKRKKKTPEQERKYQRAFGVFCVILLVDELLMATLSHTYVFVNILSIVIVVGALIGMIFYLKKNFPDG